MVVHLNELCVKYDASLAMDSLAQYGDVVSNLHQINTLLLRSTRDVSEEVRRLPGVLAATHNSTIDLHGPTDYYTAEVNREILRVCKIREAWEITKGHPDIVIGHVDTGLDSTHPDMKHVLFGGKTDGGNIDVSPNNDVRKVVLYDVVNGNATWLLQGNARVELDVYECNLNIDLGYVPAIDPYTVINPWPHAARKRIYQDAALTQEIPQPWDIDQNPNVVFYVEGPCNISIAAVDSMGNVDQRTWGFVGVTSSVDTLGHGTGTASIITSKHDGFGLAGIAPDCTLVSFAAMQTTWGFVQGIINAADWPCDIITNSWGTPLESEWPMVNDAVAYAISKGAYVVASAANDGKYPNSNTPDLYRMPGASPGAICVSGTGKLRSVVPTRLYPASDDYDYSYVGKITTKHDRTAISAPMQGWATGAPTHPHDFFWAEYPNVDGELITNVKPESYVWLRDGGTSSSGPVITGTLALMLSAAKVNGLSYTPEQVRSFLTESAQFGIKLLNDELSTLSRGNVNSLAAVQSILSGAVVPSEALNPDPPIRITKNVTDDTRTLKFYVGAGYGITSVEFYFDGVLFTTVTENLTGEISVVAPSTGTVLHDIIAKVFYSNTSYSLDEVVAINPQVAVIYADYSISGNALTWRIAGNAGPTTNHRIRRASIKLDGRVLFGVDINSYGANYDGYGVRKGVTDLRNYPQGSRVLSVTMEGRYATTPINFTPVSFTIDNAVGYPLSFPNITSFTVTPRPGKKAKVVINANDADGNITGYMVTRNSSTPYILDEAWHSEPVFETSFAREGDYTLYAWVKDSNELLSPTQMTTVSIAENVYVPPPPYATPSGGRYLTAQTVTLTDPAGGTIYYTLDGTDPITSETRAQYIDGIHISSATLIKFVAYNGGEPGDVQQAEYTFSVEGALSSVSGMGTASPVQAMVIQSINATIGSVSARGVATPLIAQATRYVIAPLGSTTAQGAAAPIAATVRALGLASVLGTGSINPVTAECARYIAAEVASANAEGRASPITASVADCLTLFVTLKGKDGVSYPMHIKGGITGFRFK